MTGGYMGKILWVDLSARTIEVEGLDEKLCRDYIGGYGIGAKLIYARQRPRGDPLGPDSILGFVTGPLTGTPAVIGSRYMVVAKSPLTQTWGDANSGGYFGPYLKFAGYDAVFVRGQSDRPVYLFVNDGKAGLRDAEPYWDRDAVETEERLKAVHGKDSRIACIGQAGERLSLISCIINDKGRAAARSGLGAVMGSQKLKAVVVKGSQKVPIADEKSAKELRREYLRQMSGPGVELYKKYGTCGVVSACVESGQAPTKNWAGVGVVDFPQSELISDDQVIKYQTKRYACWHCPIGCGGWMNIDKGAFQVQDAHKPEYETLVAFGGLCLNDDVESIIKANDLCNRYGMDTISAGATIAFAIECFERGILTWRETDGLELTWGNAGAIVELLRRMGGREGLGDLLADGIRHAAAKIGRGAEGIAMESQGQELPMQDPRFNPALAPIYKLDATPARHGQWLNWHADSPPDVFGFSERKKYEYAGTGERLRALACYWHTFTSAGLCMFGMVGTDFLVLPRFMEAVTGWDFTFETCLEAGERIANVRQAFVVREGLRPTQFTVPDRALGKPPLPSGPTEGMTIDIDVQVDQFLEAMCWDPDIGGPTEQRLLELGMDDVAADLRSS